MASRPAKTRALKTLEASSHRKKSSFPLATPMLAYLHPVLPFTLKPSPGYALKAQGYRRPRRSLDDSIKELASPGRDWEKTWQPSCDREDCRKSSPKPASPIARQRYRPVSIIGFQPIDSQLPAPISLLSRYRDRPRPYTGAGGFTVRRKSILPTPSPTLTQPPSPTRLSPQLPRPKVLVIEARIPRPTSCS